MARRSSPRTRAPSLIRTSTSCWRRVPLVADAELELDGEPVGAGLGPDHRVATRRRPWSCGDDARPSWDAPGRATRSSPATRGARCGPSSTIAARRSPRRGPATRSRSSASTICRRPASSRVSSRRPPGARPRAGAERAGPPRAAREAHDRAPILGIALLARSKRAPSRALPRDPGRRRRPRSRPPPRSCRRSSIGGARPRHRQGRGRHLRERRHARVGLERAHRRLQRAPNAEARALRRAQAVEICTIPVPTAD